MIGAMNGWLCDFFIDCLGLALLGRCPLGLGALAIGGPAPGGPNGRAPGTILNGFGILLIKSGGGNIGIMPYAPAGGMAIMGAGTIPSIFGGPKLSKCSAFLFGDLLLDY